MYDQIIQFLVQREADFVIHKHEAAHTVADAEARLPFPRERYLKTVAFRLKGGGFILAGVRGEDRVDYRKLAEAFGVKRSEIIALSPAEVKAALGVEIGSVGPIPTNDETQVVIDQKVDDTGGLFCGVGQADRTLEIRLPELVRVTQGRIVSLARDEG